MARSDLVEVVNAFLDWENVERNESVTGFAVW